MQNIIGPLLRNYVPQRVRNHWLFRYMMWFFRIPAYGALPPRPILPPLEIRRSLSDSSLFQRLRVRLSRSPDPPSEAANACPLPGPSGVKTEPVMTQEESGNVTNVKGRWLLLLAWHDVDDLVYSFILCVLLATYPVSFAN